MATEVEIHCSHTSIASLPELNALTNEPTSKRTHTSHLSDSSHKTTGISSSSNSLIAEEIHAFGKGLKPITLAVQAKPRLSPKPFTKDASLDCVRKPIMTPKLLGILRSSLPEKASQQDPADAALHTSASTIKEKNDPESDSTYVRSTAKQTFCSKPEPNKPFKTTGISRSKSLRLNQGNKAELKPTGSSQVKEWQSHPTLEVVSKQSLISRKDEILQKEMSSSVDAGPCFVESQDNEGHEFCMVQKTGLPVQLRKPQRLVPALFPEPHEGQQLHKLENKEAAPQASSSDKQLIRKTRPVSMDISSKCEGLSSILSVSASCETKENLPFWNSSAINSLEKQTVIVPKKEVPFSVSVRDCVDQDEDASLSGPSVDAFDTKNTTNITNSTRKRNYKMDGRLVNEKDKEMEMLPAVATPERNKGSRSDKPMLDEVYASLDQRDHVGVVDVETSENFKGENRTPGSTIKKRISLLFSVSSTPPVDAKLQTNEKEQGNTSIQQRIKELTAENADQKLGSTQRSFQSRPLSADLTKIFLGHGLGNEDNSEKSPDRNSEHFEGMEVHVEQDSGNQKNNEDRMFNQAYSDGSSSEGIAWQRHATVSDKEGRLRKQINASEHRSLSFRSKPSMSHLNYYDESTKQTISLENEGLKTVRTTLIDHKVKQCTVADALSVTDSEFMTSGMPVRKSVLDCSAHERETQIKNELVEKILLREEYCRRLVASDHNKQHDISVKHVPYYVEGNRHSVPLMQCTLNEYNESSSNYEDTKCQRVEPKYEVIQMIGERVLSEPISIAPEDKAVTLKSRKSSFHNKGSTNPDVKIQTLDAPFRFLGKKDNQSNEATSVSKTKNIAESTLEKQTFLQHQADEGCEQKDEVAQMLLKETTCEKSINLTKVHNSSGNAPDGKRELKISESSQFAGVDCTVSKSVYPRDEIASTLNPRDTSDAKSSYANSRKSRISGYESYTVNDIFSNNYPRTEVIAVDKGESRMFGLKQYHDSSEINKDEEDRTRDESENKLKESQLEGKNKKTDFAISDLKMSERWRRKTASHDIADKVTKSELTSPSSRGHTRMTDSFLPVESGMAKNESETREVTGASVGSENEPSIRGECKDTLLEANATYFAASRRMPDLKKESYFENSQSEISKRLSPNNPVSGISEVYSSTNNPAFLHSYQYTELHNNKDVSCDTYSFQKKAKEENEFFQNLSKPGMPNKNPFLDEDNHRRLTRNKSTGSIKENLIAADLFKGRKEKFSYNIEEKRCSDHGPHSRPMHIDIPKAMQKISDGNRDNVVQVKPTDSYRSGILDIDALMAEYGQNSSRESDLKDKQSKLSKDRKTVQREKSKSLRVKNEATKHRWDDQIECMSAPTSKYFAEDSKNVDIYNNEINSPRDLASDVFSGKHNRGAQLDPLDCVRQYSPSNKSNSHAVYKYKIPVKINNEECVTGTIEVEQNTTEYVPKPIYDVGVDLRQELFEKSDSSRVTLETQQWCPKKGAFKSKSKSNASKHVDQSSLANTNGGDAFMALKADLRKFKNSLSDYSSDSKSSPSAKFLDSHTECKNKEMTKVNNKQQETDVLAVQHHITDNVSKLKKPVDVLKPDFNKDSSASRKTSDIRLPVALSKKLPLSEKSDSIKHKHVDQSSLSNLEDKNNLLALKADLIKFRNSLSEYSLDSKPSTLVDGKTAITGESVAKQQKEKKNAQRKERHNLQSEYIESRVANRRSISYAQSSTDHQKDHLKQCFSRPTPASRATDTLVHDAESLYGVGSGERHSQDSFMAGSPVSENTVSNRKQPTTSWASSSSSQLEVDHHDATKPQRTASLDHSKVDMDSVDGTVLPPSVRSCPEEGDIDFSFMDPPSVLDSSALKNRVQLSRRSHRRAPTLQTQRKSKSLLSESKFAVIEETDSTWMFKDTTDEKPKKEEESEDEDEKPSKAVAQPQLLPMFPGMDPAILKGQLRKRQESDSPMEISGATHLYKSPKSSLQPGAFGGRSLPSAAENGDRSVEMSPQWLQELKSKKRLSQYDNNS
ncbi:uncharacterized protein KIAA1671 homolog [Ambystoma mexicanum]|uniref:uncharacterized protein KIAA1671 homolog n=1 Tax=Ambystoma mexicanum TaxID=8296 RepID=UPI0037E8A2BD